MTTPGQGWGNPVVGGTALRIPAINSPNFNLVTPAASPTPSWAILQSGLAYFFGLVLSGGTITGPDYIINTSGIFIYSGTPANGNLIGSWAGVAGTDAFGNTYPQGFNITQGSISGSTFNGTDFIISTAGAFFYSGTPALGNLLINVTPAGGTDAFGNVYNAGVFVYGPNGSFIGLLDNGTFAELQMLPPGPVVHETSHPAILSYSVNPGAANETMVGVFTSGTESGNDYGAVLTFAESADASGAAAVGFAVSTGAFGTNIFAIVDKTALTLFGIPLVVKSNTSPSVTFIPSGAVHVSTNPQSLATTVSAGAANEQLLSVLSSGKESSKEDAALQLFSESADATVPARVVIEFGGAVVAEFHRDGGVQLDGVSSTPAGSSNNAVLFATTKGNLQVVDGLDGTVYGTQRRTLILNSDTPVAASPGTTVFSSTVGVRSYHVHGMIIMSISGATQTFSINIAPPSGTGHAGAHLGRAAVLVSYTEFNLNSLTAIGGATLAVGNKYICWFDTIINVTGAGSLNIICAGTNANDITILANSYVEILPV